MLIYEIFVFVFILLDEMSYMDRFKVSRVGSVLFKVGWKGRSKYLLKIILFIIIWRFGI